MKLFFTFASMAVIITVANATVHTVTCQNTPSHFLPVTVYAELGDTIHWIWVAGIHEVGPKSASDIPMGAATWYAPIDVSNTSFYYVATVAGNYYYVCHPGTPHGEDAYLVVADTVTTGVQQYNTLSNLSFVYPNPSNGKFQFVIDGSQINKNSKVEIYNLKGQIIYQSVITKTKSNIDLSNHANGIYFVKFYTEQSIFYKKIVIQ